MNGTIPEEYDIQSDPPWSDRRIPFASGHCAVPEARVRTRREADVRHLTQRASERVVLAAVEKQRRTGLAGMMVV